ncbi:MAG: hypothetical protein ACTS2F_29985 [Thainema sp.]
MRCPPLRPWIFRVEPCRDESFSHFLGRFRRANQLSRQTLGELLSESACDRSSSVAIKTACDRALMTAWETPSRRCQPTEAQLDQLAHLMQLTSQQLTPLLFPPNGSLSPTTRLCAACYRAEPIHRRCWQRADLVDCPSHHAPFLTQCPACQTALRLPSLWALGRCERCWLPFEQMGATSEPEEA